MKPWTLALWTLGLPLVGWPLCRNYFAAVLLVFAGIVIGRLSLQIELRLPWRKDDPGAKPPPPA